MTQPTYTYGFLESPGMEPLLSDEDASRKLGLALIEIKELLGLSLHENKKLDHHPLNRWLRAIVRYKREGQPAARDWELFRLHLLLTDLRTVSKADPTLFRHFRRTVRRLTQNEYFGWRCEVRMAVLLHRAGVSFVKQESPDYVADTASGPAAIECGTSNVPRAVERDYTAKLLAVINEKNRKPYAKRNCLLAIDFTSSYFGSLVAKTPLNLQQVHSHLLEGVATLRYGALLAMTQIIDTAGAQIATALIPVLNQNAEPSTASLLERLAPPGIPVPSIYTVPFSL